MSFDGGVILTDPVKPSKSKKANKKAGKVPAVQQKAQEATIESKANQEESTHRVTLHKHLRKTRFCMYHFQGACQFGTECSFAHNLTEMHQTPNLRKTQLCKAYAEGGCTDPTCAFAHGDDELRSTEMFFKKTLCIWNEKGKCRNGEKCRFAHGPRELRASQAPGEGSIGEPAAAQGNARRQKGSKEKATVPLATADPMKVSPGNFAHFNQALVGQPPVQPLAVPPNVLNTTGSNSNLNGELATLCQSIAILTAQCSNIQKRMELEQEFKNMQCQPESTIISPQGYAMPGQGLSYHSMGLAGPPGVMMPQTPFPPGLDAVPGVMGGLMPQKPPGVMGGVMPQMSPAMMEVLQNMKALY